MVEGRRCYYRFYYETRALRVRKGPLFLPSFQRLLYLVKDLDIILDGLLSDFKDLIDLVEIQHTYFRDIWDYHVIGEGVTIYCVWTRHKIKNLKGHTCQCVYVIIELPFIMLSMNIV